MNEEYTGTKIIQTQSPYASNLDLNVGQVMIQLVIYQMIY